MERGQTNLDFAVGVSIFIFSIVFVFAFVPGTLQPFTGSAQGETVASDHVADRIVKDMLAEPGEPYLLDGECTAALMADRSAPECDFDGGDLSTRLDVPDLQSINITMRGDPDGSGTEYLCWDDAGGAIVSASDGDCDAILVAGDDAPVGSDSVVTARRIVAIDGERAVVEVSLW